MATNTLIFDATNIGFHQSSVITGTADTRLRMVVYSADRDQSNMLEVWLSTPAGITPLSDLNENKTSGEIVLAGDANCINIDGSFDYVLIKRSPNPLKVYKVT
jgi:hypothetical protein